MLCAFREQRADLFGELARRVFAIAAHCYQLIRNNQKEPVFFEKTLSFFQESSSVYGVPFKCKLLIGRKSFEVRAGEKRRVMAVPEVIAFGSNIDAIQNLSMLP